jgi:hypothetical protein
MAPSVKVQKFWVYVVPSPKATEANKFTIAIKPAHHRNQTITKKPFVFVSQRTFASETRAVQEAVWLFGQVKWERDGKRNLPRARLEFAQK